MTQTHTQEILRQLALVLADSIPAQVQAVGRLDQALLELKAAGHLSSFTIGTWNNDEISVSGQVPDHLYFADHRLMVRQRLSAAIEELPVYVSVTLKPV